jgi:MFS family permease
VDLLGSIAVDLGLLRRRRDYGLMTLSQFVSSTGSMASMVAVPFQVYAITHSSVAVGLLGLAELVPILVLALLGGALADSVDRRRLVIAAESGAAFAAGALFWNAALDDPHLWVVYAASALLAACYSMLRPPLDALVPQLVAKDELKAAGAIDFLFGNMAQIGGPALGGILIAAFGVTVAYAVDAGSFVLSAGALWLMHPPPALSRKVKPSLRSIVEGFRYARSRQELVGTYLVDMAAMFFAMPMALFPQISEQYGGAKALGLLFAAPAIGSLLASLTSGWSAHVHRHGRAVALAAAGWGLAIAGFGFAGSLWLAVVFLALAGAFDAISGIFRSTIWNSTIPDHLRGRLAGIEMISWSSGPLLGNVRAGSVASAVGLRGSIVSGGLLCAAACAALALALPRFWAYAADPPSEEDRIHGDDRDRVVPP